MKEKFQEGLWLVVFAVIFGSALIGWLFNIDGGTSKEECSSREECLELFMEEEESYQDRIWP